ncbi:MAG: DNA polymerase III subunit gamma/tau [Candidatus Actinomarina sp.]|nr:DNA polymerase III subunit gamma/tau [Candidatus Actinomarina sp.]MBL6762692.1 DNA polymerase III subunit gamma/tau [Candidatus Actinomarina sp.]MBL6835900.1 DNA polymerase III subunit gamma/tau [Candidatus Actinomarina sp.]
MQEALYRKYRPSSLEELVGQADAVQLIREQIKNGNLSHAYLFSGPRGVGKTSLARIIATTIGCDPVFDITEIDAASHNKVDDVRELNDSVNFIASSPGKKRVFILDEVHMLSNAASNAFLKTLEEPPEHVIFILATTEPERVIETIRSRTTQIAFKRIKNSDIITSLEKIGKAENINLSKDVLEYIANQSDGSLRDAINLFEQTFSTFGNKATMEQLYSILGKVTTTDLLQILEAMGTQDTATVLKVLRANYKNGLQAIDILNSITDLFRNLFYFKYLPDDESFTSLGDSEKDLIKNCNDIISAKDLSRILDMLDEINQSIKTSPSQELKLELFLVKLIKPQLATDIKSVSRRVDMLEKYGVSEKISEKKQTSPDKKKLANEKVAKDKPKKENTKKSIVKNDIENFDVYWPKILEEAKSILTPRKYSYLTLVKPEVIDSNNLTLYIDSENEYLISELRKSDEIIELIKSNVTQKMGVEVTVAIQPHEGLQNNNQTSKDVQSNISEIFDVESID